MPHWPSVSEQPATTMELGDKSAAIPVAASKAKLSFFERFFARQRLPAGR
jgi:hypothetical protein